MNTLIRNYPRNFNSLLDSFFHDTASSEKPNRFVPTSDVKEDDNAFFINVSVPGMDKKDINLEIKDKSIIISGEKNISKDEKKDNFHRIENQYGFFKRSFLIPDSVNSAKIEAKYNNGMLEIMLPKEEKAKLESKIDIL